MKRNVIMLAASALLCLSASCEKEKTPEPAAAAPYAMAAPTVAAPVAAPAPANENVPVAADFEDEAEKTITSANYKKELDSLEAEIK